MTKDIEQGDNLALALILALRAYKPKVTVEGELQFNLAKERAKRRTRPLAGRGYYSEFLRTHFAERRAAKLKGKA